MKRKTWIALAAGSVMTAALLAWAFAPRPVEVEAVAATRGPFETAVEEDGRTRVRERHVLTAPMAGRLRRIALREGDAVQAGQVLALIDPLAAPLLDDRARREQQARVAAAQAVLERAATRVRAADVGVDQAVAVQRRTEQLVAQGFVSPAQGDADRLALQAAQREREAAADSERVARHELEQARAVLGGSASLRGTFVGAQAGGRRSGANAVSSWGDGADGAVPAAAYAVRAPIAGRVLRVHQASEGVVGLGTPLLDLADTARLEVVAELLTSDAAWASPGSPVRLERWGGPGVLSGRVRSVEPAAFTKVSALGVEEQRVHVVIDLDDAPVPGGATSGTDPPQGVSEGANSTARLGDGWRVVVRILTRQESDVLRVPVSAVFPWPGPARATDADQDAADRMAVFVVEAGRARLRPVQVAARNGSLAWVRAGLEPGERVVAYPPPAVADGVRVQVRKG